MLFKIADTEAPVQCDERLFADAPLLRFGKTNGGTVVFDASFHSSQALNSTFQEGKFMTCCRAWIETLAKDSGIPTSGLFFRNTDGHILVARELAVLYLMWADPGMLIYITGLAEDALTDGFALSDGMLVSMVHAKVPDRVLEVILETRRNEKS